MGRGICRQTRYDYIEPMVHWGRELLSEARYFHSVSMLDDPFRIRRVCNGATFSFLDGHAELWRWKGTALIALNRQYNSDDTRAPNQRPSSTSNPLNPSPSTANDPDYLKLADALPEP